MPQARRAHQPRSASNATKTPKANRATASQIDRGKQKPAPTKSAKEMIPRTSRPLLSMLREKESFILWFGVTRIAYRPEMFTLKYQFKTGLRAVFFLKKWFQRLFRRSFIFKSRSYVEHSQVASAIPSSINSGLQRICKLSRQVLCRSTEMA